MVSDSLLTDESANKGSERENRSAPPSYSEIFLAKFPYYLSIGMTEEQYWDRDSTLVKSYRKAEELRKERVNQEMWLQGMYIYDAISRLSPILRAFAKKGTKAQPYVEEAYPINKKTVEEAELKKEKLSLKRVCAICKRIWYRQISSYKKGSEFYAYYNRTTRIGSSVEFHLGCRWYRRSFRFFVQTQNAVRGGVGLTSVAIKYAISIPPLKAWIVPGQTRLTSSLPVWKN